MGQKLTKEQKAALAEYRGPVTICPPAPAMGAPFTIEDSTLAAGGPEPKRAAKSGPSEDTKALLAGERFYHGEPCRRCGATLRYASNRACVACVRARARRRKNG